MVLEERSHRRTTARLLARSVLLGLAAAWGLWLLGAQVLLWTPLLRGIINRESPALHVEYSFAWSIWPGTVHVRRLVITGEDRAVQWRLGLDRAAASIALWQLPRRIFHVTRVRADGTQFALRRRLSWPEATPDRLAGLPWLDGLPPRPIKPEGPDDDTPDYRYRLYTVWLENLQSSNVRQIWIDRYRLEGPGDVAGAFYLKPIREVLVRPAELRIHGGHVMEADQRIADGIDATLRVRMGPFDPRSTKGLDLFRVLDVDLEGESALQDGSAKAGLHVQAGQVLAGSSLALDLSELTVHGVKARSARLDFRTAPPSSAHASIDLRDVRAGPIKLAHARIELGGDTPDLADPKPPRSVKADLRGGDIDARALSADGVQIDEGRGTFVAQLEGPPDRLRGSARGSISQALVRAHGETFRGDVEVDAQIAALDPKRGADLSGTRLSIDRAKLLHADGSADAEPDWWGHFLFPRAQVRFAPQPVVDGELTARCRDARPIVGLYVDRADLPGIVKSLFTMDGLNVRASAAAGKDWTALRDLDASGEGASIRATLRSQQGEQRGALALTVRGIAIGIDLDEGGSSLHLFSPNDFVDERRAELFQGDDKVVGRLPRARAPRSRRHAAPVQTAR